MVSFMSRTSDTDILISILTYSILDRGLYVGTRVNAYTQGMETPARIMKQAILCKTIRKILGG